MTQEQDSFPQPPAPQQPGVVNPGVVNPGVVAPGMVAPGTAAPAQTNHPGGFLPPRPTALAVWATVLTGVVAVLSLVSSVVTLATFDENRAQIIDSLESPAASAAENLSTSVWSTLADVAMVASFVFLALWMHRIRANLTAIGRRPGGVPAVEWWGWFVPLANFVLPALGMRAITRRSSSAGLVWGWWLAFCAYWVASFVAVGLSFSMIDFQSGTFNGNTDPVDAMVWCGILVGFALAISWVFLALILRGTTARHLER